jgi:hypothetical protein
LTGIADLPRLEIVPVAKLVLHEHHDEQRTPPLMEKLETSGVLRNPPIVIRMRKLKGHFMVLDGANRSSAFEKLGITDILVQVIDPQEGQLDLRAWNHVVWNLSPDELLNGFQTIPGVNLQPSRPSRSYQDLMDIQSLVSLHLPEGDVFTVFASTVDLHERVRFLNKVVKSYCEIASIDRTSVHQIQPLCDLYEDLAGLVLMPTFEVYEVLDIVEAGSLMPPGSTCFRIAPRVLHVNYPLETLQRDVSIDQKNADLRAFLCNCLETRCVRYYAEPTFLFDE